MYQIRSLETDTSPASDELRLRNKIQYRSTEDGLFTKVLTFMEKFIYIFLSDMILGVISFQNIYHVERTVISSFYILSNNCLISH